MTPEILSLHHVTATVTDAQADLDFYAGLLGLRLVKTTVNFDNPAVYHLYYGDERGTPSTLMTTFPYQGWGVPVGVRGTGQIHVTAFSVPTGALPFWRERFTAKGAAFVEAKRRFGSEAVRIEDPSGLLIELVEAPRDERAPWLAPGIAADSAIRGVHDVTLLLRALDPSLDFLVGTLGFREVGRDGDRTRVAVGAGGPGAVVDLMADPEAPRGVNGLGTVHHVAFAVQDDAAQLRSRGALVQGGYAVTEVRDRQYFRSIYFREPGGVLYEIATLDPGFAIDEELAHLGEALRLPRWEEPNRRQIEAQLAPIDRGSASGSGAT